MAWASRWCGRPTSSTTCLKNDDEGAARPLRFCAMTHFASTPEDIAARLHAAGRAVSPADLRLETRDDRLLVRWPGDELAWAALNPAGAAQLAHEGRVLARLQAKCFFKVPEEHYRSPDDSFSIRGVIAGRCDAAAVQGRMRRSSGCGACRRTRCTSSGSARRARRRTRRRAARRSRHSAAAVADGCLAQALKGQTRPAAVLTARHPAASHSQRSLRFLRDRSCRSLKKLSHTPMRSASNAYLSIAS